MESLLRGQQRDKCPLSHGLIDDLVAAAQSIYDAWDQSGPDGDIELGFGGICQDIASAMAGVLNGTGINAMSCSSSCGEQHVFVVAQFDNGVFEVDISPYVYEYGSGYTWTKKTGVTISPDDITFLRLSADPARFDDFADD